MKKVLYIEDNVSDVALFEEALKDNQIDLHLTVLTDAEEFMEFLSDVTDMEDENIPDLIISDVSLPKINGSELIKRVSEHKILQHTPIVAYSTSSYQKDIEVCKANGAVEYYQKPMNYYDTLELVGEICQKWLGITAKVN